MDRLPSEVLAKIRQGRAVLLAGQDLNAGEAARILDANRTISQFLRAPTQAETEKLEILRAEPAAAAHVDVARQPWSLVLTSALDTRLTSALEAAAPLARRVRRRFVNDPDASVLTRNPTSLPVTHLLLERNPAGLDGVVPAASSLSRLSRILVPAILRPLSEAVGPNQVVVIAGIGPWDGLSRDDLAAALSDLDPAQVLLCAPDGDAEWLTDTLPGATVLRATLASLLEADRLERGEVISSVLEAGDLAVAVREEASETRRSVVFRASELQEIKRFVTVLPDGFPRPPALREEVQAAFERFVRTPRFRADYDSYSSEFCVVRDAYRKVRTAVEARLARLTGQGRTPSGSAGPILLTGYPGSGRTTGLHWLGAEMRSAGWCVLYLATGDIEPDSAAIEQVVRLVEGRLREAGAAEAVVILVDGLARGAPEQLDDRLRRAGRKALVVATGTPRGVGLDSAEVPRHGQEIRLGYALSLGEVEALASIMRSVGRQYSTDQLAQLSKTEGFLGVLDRVLPGGQVGIREVLRGELQRALALIGEALLRAPERLPRGALGEQLAAAFAARGQALPSAAASPTHTGTVEAREFMACVFLLASLDRPPPLDLLTRRFPRLLRNYEDVRRVGEASGFLAEVSLPENDDSVLAPINPALVRILKSEFGAPLDRIDELARLARLCTWPSGGGTLGDLPRLTRIIFEALRAMSPRGDYEHDYQSADSLGALRDILRELREEHGFALPQALQLEAMLLRAAARTDTADLRHEKLRLCLDLLQNAAEDIERRPRSMGRDRLLGSILVTRGTAMRELMGIEMARNGPAAAEQYGIEALSAAKRSQALQDSWHPFDVACTVYRDIARAWQTQQPTDPGAERRNRDALSRLAMVLDLGPEASELDQRQKDFRRDREQDYLLLSQGVQVARAEAEATAAQGDVSGLCHVVRHTAFDILTGRLVSLQAGEDAFRSLYHFTEAAIADERSRALLLRLWSAVALRARSLDDGPHVVALDTYWWDAIERITEPDSSSGLEPFRPIAGFWLVTALLRRGATGRIKPVLREMEDARSAGRARSIEPLVVVPDAEKQPRLFRAIVRRSEIGRQLFVYVPDLDLDVQIQQRHRSTEFLDAKPRDIIDMHVATNMRGVLGIGPAWLAGRRSH